MHCWSVRHGRWTPLIHLPTTGYDPSIASAGHPSLTCSAHRKVFSACFYISSFSNFLPNSPAPTREPRTVCLVPASHADSRYPSPASDSSEWPTSRLSPSASECSKTGHSAACSSGTSSESLHLAQAFFPISAYLICVVFRSVSFVFNRACCCVGLAAREFLLSSCRSRVL